MMEAAAMMARQKLAGAKKYNQSVMKAVKASPAGMFPAAAAKAGIKMGSKLGQAITKSGAGKMPRELKSGAVGGQVQKPKPRITVNSSKNNANQAKNIATYNKNITNMAGQRASAMKNIAKTKAQMYLGGSATFNERGSASSKLGKALIAQRKKR